MDIFDAFIANMHLMLGHDKTADFIGMPRGDKSQCRLCNGEDPHAVFDGTERWDGNSKDAATWLPELDAEDADARQ